MNTTYSAPDPATRLSDWDRKLLGLPADPTKKSTRLVWNKQNIAATFAVTVLAATLAIWGMLLLTEGDSASGPAEGPTDTIYIPETGQIVQEGTGIVLEETR